MTIANLIIWATSALRNSHGPTGRLDTLVLLEHVLRRDRAWLLAHSEAQIGKLAELRFKNLIKRRAQKVPVAYLTGTKEFYGLPIKINDRVLTPRPESEQLVEFAIAHTAQNATLLDLGTGSGCLAVAIAKHRPDLKVTASDISKAALNLAKVNMQTHQVSVQFLESDLFEQLGKQKYATIVANLPYVRNDLVVDEATKHEPKLAVRGGVDGLKYYRRFFNESKSHLKPKGVVIVEALPDQHPALIRLARSAGFKLLDQVQLGLVFKAV